MLIFNWINIYQSYIVSARTPNNGEKIYKQTSRQMNAVQDERNSFWTLSRHLITYISHNHHRLWHLRYNYWVYWFYRSTNIMFFHPSETLISKLSIEEQGKKIFITSPPWWNLSKPVGRIESNRSSVFPFFFRGKKLSLWTAMRHDRGTFLRIDDLIPRMRGTKRPAASVWRGGWRADHRDCNFNANLTRISLLGERNSVFMLNIAAC